MIVEGLELKYESNVASNTKLWFEIYSPLARGVVSSRLLILPQPLDNQFFKKFGEDLFPNEEWMKPFIKNLVRISGWIGSYLLGTKYLISGCRFLIKEGSYVRVFTVYFRWYWA